MADGDAEVSKAATKAAAAAARKVNKKQARALDILKKDTGIEESCGPSKVLFVCNAGLVTGVANSDLVRVFAKFGPIERVVMVPKKSYSFLVFTRVESAEAAMAGVHGKVGLSEGGPLYLAPVTCTPPVLDPWDQGAPPPGVRVIPDYVSEEEERELLGLLTWQEGEEGRMKHRQVKHFGFEFNYKTNNIDPSEPLLDQPIPPLCASLGSRVVSEDLIEDCPDQITVNRYLPGQGIPPHTDSHSCCSSSILSLSLASGVVIEFRGPKEEQVPVWLPQRSLLVLAGEARYTWRHGITPRHCDTLPGHILGQGEGLTLAHRDTRVSLTFRRTLTGPCSCPYPAHCDRVTRAPSPTAPLLERIAERAAQLESQLVHQVYEEIAGHFSETRHTPWPRVTAFLDTAKPGGLILDLGCGNGKYLGQGEGARWELGGDYSQNLLGIVVARGHQALRCDLLAIPLLDGCTSSIICIAALHHLASQERRLAALQEVHRVLEPYGRVLVYVWAKDQSLQQKSTYLRQNKRNITETGAEQGEVGSSEGGRETGEYGLPVHVNRTEFQHQDNLVPWKRKGREGEDQVFMRYYHVFEEGELEALVGEVAGLQVVESYYDQGNWCVVAERSQ